MNQNNRFNERKEIVEYCASLDSDFFDKDHFQITDA